jgi:hypothetical protein
MVRSSPPFPTNFHLSQLPGPLYSHTHVKQSSFNSRKRTLLPYPALFRLKRPLGDSFFCSKIHSLRSTFMSDKSGRCETNLIADFRGCLRVSRCLRRYIHRSGPGTMIQPMARSNSYHTDQLFREKVFGIRLDTNKTVPGSNGHAQLSITEVRIYRSLQWSSNSVNSPTGMKTKHCNNVARRTMVFSNSFCVLGCNSHSHSQCLY